jgi:uncharacterized protein YciI
MRLVVIFEDTPPMADIRARLEPAHIEYLRAHSDEILIAGGLRDASGAGYVGGLWVLEVPSKERAVRLVEDDPYYVSERRPYRMLRWGKALPERMAAL